MPSTANPTSAQRIELILQQVESLPTLPAVAMKLLQITSDEDSDAQQVIELVKNDPALTGKILALCRSSTMGVRSNTVTVDRAVVFLGFESIRNAVLSIKVFETFSEDSAADAPDDRVRFQRPMFWRHCLAVAVAAELIAARHPEIKQFNPAEAFVCGLLHDIGKLALEHVLPKSYQRVVELTEAAQTNIADVERKVLGIDHFTAGKRLAERWGLSHCLSDCIWLHGAAPAALPDVPHRKMIGLIGLADLAVRRHHIGYSGNYQMPDLIAARAKELGLDPVRVDNAVAEVHDEIQKRAISLGLDTEHGPSRKLFLESIMQANTLLGRLNAQLAAHRSTAGRQAHTITAITHFHSTAAGWSRSVSDVLGAVVSSAASVLGGGHFGMIYQGTDQREWQVSQYNAEGRVVRSQLVDPPPGVNELADLTREAELPVGWMGVLPWLSDYLVGFEDLRKLRMLPLPCAWGTAAVLVHDRGQLPDAEHLEALTRTWGAAVGAATQHEGARRLGEQLAEANRVLTETQDTLLKHQSLARLGEMAAGAAHEMNNPLAVISGRAQLLSMKLPHGTKEQADAALVYQQAQKLSDLITALHLFAEPPRPKVQLVAVDDVMEAAIRKVRTKMPNVPAVTFNPSSKLPPLRTDADHLSSILAELLLNAHEAQPDSPVKVAAQVDPLDDRLVFKVIDDGVGMDAHTLEHAFDPFFSAKTAGRQTGLGLARVQRLVEGLGGSVDLESTEGLGATATVRLPIVGAETANPDITEAEQVDPHASSDASATRRS